VIKAVGVWLVCGGTAYSSSNSSSSRRRRTRSSKAGKREALYDIRC
jgi:hypothetical protein